MPIGDLFGSFGPGPVVEATLTGDTGIAGMIMAMQAEVARRTNHPIARINIRVELV
jgi:hypothetical protein